MKLLIGTHGKKGSLGRLAIGATVGAVGTALFIITMGDRLDMRDLSTALTVVAGLSYTLIGLLVGLGVVVPNAGAKVLNVEDSDELREEGPKLGRAAIVYVLIGLFLLALLAAPGTATAGTLSREAAAIAAGLCLMGAVWMSMRMAGTADELTRQLSLEAAALTLHLAVPLFAGWAALAHLDYVAWMTPLTFVSGIALLQLFAVFLVGAKRGLLAPRW